MWELHGHPLVITLKARRSRTIWLWYHRAIVLWSQIVRLRLEIFITTMLHWIHMTQVKKGANLYLVQESMKIYFSISVSCTTRKSYVSHSVRLALVQLAVLFVLILWGNFSLCWVLNCLEYFLLYHTESLKLGGISVWSDPEVWRDVLGIYQRIFSIIC